MSHSSKIERIELTLFDVDIPDMSADPSGFGIHYTPGKSEPQLRLAIKVFGDTGVIGEYVPGRRRARIIHAAAAALGQKLIGQPALERELHYYNLRRLTKHVGEVGIGILDIALWDLAGKHHNAPVYQLLGSACPPTPAPCTATGCPAGFPCAATRC